MSSGAYERAIEVHAFHQRIGGNHLERVPLRLEDRGIVADPHNDPRRRRGASRADTLDDGPLADLAYRSGFGIRDSGFVVPHLLIQSRIPNHESR
jgi:hypothetical protein